MDNPIFLVTGMFCLAPLAIFGLGVWVGRGLPGLPYRVRFERAESYDAPREGKVSDAWQP